MKNIKKILSEIPVILWIVFSIGFALRIYFSFAIEYSIIHGITSDDSFYYFRIAQNIAMGFGSSFDRITTTNGYQPLVMVPLVFFYKIISSTDIFTPIYLMQLFLSFINLSAGILTYFLVLKITKGSKLAGIFTVTILFLNPVFISINFKSLETNLYWFFLTFTLNYFYNNFEKGLKSKDFLLGLLIAFSALSRLDGAFLIVAFAIVMLFKKGWQFKQKFDRVFYTGLGFSVIFIPYMLFNQIVFGAIMPISGQAKIFHNHRAVLSNVGSYWSFDFLLYEIKRFIFPIDFDSLLERGFGPLEKILVIICFICFILFIFYLWRNGFLNSVFSKFKPINFFWLFLLFHYSYYTLYFWEYRFYYFMPQILMISIVIGMFLDIVIKKYSKINIADNFYKNLSSKLIFGMIILFYIFIGYRQLNAVHGQTLVYLAGNWIAENVKGDPVMSSANAGILSYYSQKRIINLDGMVNNKELLDAFAKGDDDYLEYLRKYKIEYICDYLGVPPVNKYFFPKNLNDKYIIEKEFTDKRLKYQILKEYVILRVNP